MNVNIFTFGAFDLKSDILIIFMLFFEVKCLGLTMNVDKNDAVGAVLGTNDGIFIEEEELLVIFVLLELEISLTLARIRKIYLEL